MKFIICIILLFTSCRLSHSVNYLGRSYTPTKTVDIYFENETINENYKIIGKAFLEINVNSSLTTEDMQEAFIYKAKEKGANAIVLSDLEHRHGDLIHEVNVYEKSDKDKEVEVKDKKHKKRKKKDKKKLKIEETKNKNKTITERNYRKRYIKLNAVFIRYVN